MKRILWAAAAVLTLGAPLAAQTAEADARLLAERDALRKSVQELTAKYEALEKTWDEKTLFAQLPKARTAILPLAQLKAMRLPIGATKDEARQYVKGIVDASRKQESFAVYDPQVFMLQRVGPEHVDVLLENIDACPAYIVPAVRPLAEERHKAAVLAALPRHPGLMDVFLDRKWLDDAKPALIAELAKKPEVMPSSWLYALCQIKDEATYPALKGHMVQSRRPMDVYLLLRDVPKMDLKESVAALWARTRQEAWLSPQVVPIALDFGHADALEYAVRALGKDPDLPGGLRYARAILLQHLDASGDNEQIAQWYDKNRDKLVFDAERKRFTLHQEK